MSEVLDCVIVGQGLAGSWMATVLAGRGWKLRVYDDGSQSAASRVASGMMTPLTGKRLVPTWRLDPLLDLAKAAYAEQERELGCALIDDRPSLRVFSSEDQAQRWDKRANEPALLPYLGERYAAGARVHGIELPFGGCTLLQGARVDVRAWVQKVRDKLAAQGAYVQRRVDLEAVVKDGEHWVVEGERCRRVVFCLGYQAMQHQLTRRLPFKPARGDLIEVTAPALSASVHLQAGVSLTALGSGKALVGGNYDWRDIHGGPSQGHAQTLLTKVQEIIGQPLSVVGHRCGVRPIVEGRVPVLGEIEGHSGAYLLNGLASKGTMWAPWMARHLCDVMEGTQPVDPELCATQRRIRFGVDQEG